VSPSLSLISIMYALNSASHGQKMFCFVPRSVYISFSVCRHFVKFSLLIFGSKMAMSSSHRASEQKMWKRVLFSTRLTAVKSHSCCWVMSCTYHRPTHCINGCTTFHHHQQHAPGWCVAPRVIPLHNAWSTASSAKLPPLYYI